MRDYQRGKIYKITSGDLIYIGSTCEPTLARRLSNHVSNYKGWKQGKQKNTTSFLLIETGQYEITLIELFPCGSRDELTARERFYIETNDCVNKIIPGRTTKEWYSDNKEIILEKSRAFREANKELILERARIFREKETNKDKKRAYREENRELLAEKQLAYYEANRDKINTLKRERRAKPSIIL